MDEYVQAAVPYVYANSADAAAAAAASGHIVSPLERVAQMGVYAHTVQTVGDTFSNIIFIDLPLILLAALIFGFFVMLGYLAALFIRKVAHMLRVRVNVTAITVFITVLLFAAIGAFVALRELGVDFSHIFIGLGIAGLAAAQIFVAVFGNVAAGISVRASSYLQPGSEVTMSTALGPIRGVVLEHGISSVAVELPSKANATTRDVAVVPNTNFSSSVYIAHLPLPPPPPPVAIDVSDKEPTRQMGVTLTPSSLTTKKDE